MTQPNGAPFQRDPPGCGSSVRLTRENPGGRLPVDSVDVSIAKTDTQGGSRDARMTKNQLETPQNALKPCIPHRRAHWQAVLRSQDDGDRCPELHRGSPRR